MGLDSNSVRFLLYSQALGADFRDCAMIGRQGLHASRAELRECFAAFSREIGDAALSGITDGHGGYAEGLLRYLGAEQVHSFDYSDYERATHVHDMNQPIPEGLRGRYSVVIDGGSLEHVFNFPVAIRNCLEMTAVGGHYVTITPANNFFGHGFYQFSPELYYRVLSESNGFEVRAAMMFEEFDQRWYRVPDPKVIGRRVTLVNTRPTYLAMLGRKIDDRPVFASTPQQSDYVAIWNAGRKETLARGRSGRGGLDFVSRLVPAGAKRGLRRLAFTALDLHAIDDSPELFQPIDPPSDASVKRTA
jgi:hypothetical protein